MEIKRLSESSSILESCVDLAEAFNSESPFGTKFNRSHVGENILKLVSSGLGEFFLASDGEITLGFFGAVISPDLLTDEIKAQELCWYVLPEHRKGRTAIKLFNAFEKWAISQDAKRLIMTHLEGTPSVSKFYQRRGYEPIERNFLKTIK